MNTMTTEQEIHRFRLTHALRSVEDAIILLERPAHGGFDPNIAALKLIREDLDAALRQTRKPALNG
jgi:hypothetical protein